MKAKRFVMFSLFSVLILVLISGFASATSPIGKKTDCYANLQDAFHAYTRACDNNNVTDWQSSAGGFPKWLVVNLTKTWILESVAIVFPAFFGSDQFTIQYQSGASWIDDGTFTAANCNSGSSSNQTFTLTTPATTAAFRLYWTAQHGCASYVTLDEVWPTGSAVPPSCALGAIGMTLDTLIPILVAAGLIAFSLGFFYIALDSKGHGKKGFSMELLIVGAIGLVVAIAVTAGVIASMKVC